MLRVAVLCSRKAPGLVDALVCDPRAGLLYDVVVCVTSEPGCADAGLLAALDVPVITHDIHEFYRVRESRLADRAVRKSYDRITLHLLAQHRPDLVLCCGYLYVLTDAFLAAFRGPVVNLHHSDLCDPCADGSPRYPGLRAVRDAIVAGETQTRSTAHLVTAAVDAGPPLVRSWPFPVSAVTAAMRACSAHGLLSEYVRAHERWMLRAAWPPLLRATFDLFARGRVTWDRDPPLIDGRDCILELDAAGNAFPVEHAVAATRMAGV